MPNTRLTAFIAAAAIAAGACGAHLDRYPKERCAVNPSDKLTAAIRRYCVRCHSKDFADAGEICSRKSLIIDSVKAGRMPKYGTLPEAERAIIINWK